MQIQGASKKTPKRSFSILTCLKTPFCHLFSLLSVLLSWLLSACEFVCSVFANQQPSFYCHASATNEQGAATESCVFARLGVYKGAETVTCWLGGARVVADGGFDCGEATNAYSHHTLARTMGLT